MSSIQHSFLSIAALALLGGCSTIENAPSLPSGLPASNVMARIETAPVGTVNADAADDPAIWRNPSDPANSLIVGTDKKAGLYVYGLDGKIRDFLPAGQLNNVDLIGDEEGALVIASDRADRENSYLALFRLSSSGKLQALGKIASGPGEAYGLCLQKQGVSHNGKASSTITAYAAIKDGSVQEIRLTSDNAGTWSGTLLRNWKIPTQIEGCATNSRNGDLFIGEENAGIWKIQTSQANPRPELFASLGAEDGLVADVEGLAFARQENGPDYLIASSQGDNAYALFNVATGKLAGRFRIMGGEVGGTQIDGTSETDGIELLTGDLPNFPGGLFIAQDGDNSPEAQNFKFVSWNDILTATGLRQ